MAGVIYEPAPRYVVEVADARRDGHGRYAGGWDFRHAFELLPDAEAMAVRLAEENEYVRVIDRAATDNKENN